MKKLLFSFIVLMLPFILSAQMMDTTVVFYENFDGATIQMTSSNQFQETNWFTVTNVAVSQPSSFRGKLYPSNGNTYCLTSAIEVDRTKPYVYLKFDHIGKSNNNDQCLISYQKSTGMSEYGDIQWGMHTNLNFTQTSPFYHGGATNITNGNISQNWYTDWKPTQDAAVPDNSWWKTELFDLSSFVASPTEDNEFFRIRFLTNHASGTGSGTEACAGWFLDNVQIIYSNVELVPPAITLQNPTFVGTINNNTGPFLIKARITDNDTVNVNTIFFKYETSDGVVDSIPATITSNSFSGGKHVVDCQWTIPMQCYGTTVDYHISVSDVHGSESKADYQFALRTTQSLQVNDAQLESFSDLPIYPDYMQTGQSYPIKVAFRNKGKATEENPNHMTSAVFGWSVNGVSKPNFSWTGDLCLDYTDTVIVGNHVATEGPNFIKVWIISRNGVSPLVNPAHDTITYDGYACSSSLSGAYTLGGSSADFPTVEYMKERFHRCGLAGPVTININAGTYTGFNFDEQYPGLDNNNTITFQAAPGVATSDVIIVNSGNNAPVEFTEMAYVTIRNVTIRNNVVGRCVDFTGRYSHHISIDHCTIQGTTSTTTPLTNSVAIGRTTAATPFTGGQGDNNFSFTNNTISNVNYGIYFVGGSNAAYKEEDFTISGNTINSTVGGIQTSQSKTWTIDGNTINQMATASDMNFTGINIQNCSDFSSISGNRIHMNERGGTGISTSSYSNSNGVTTNLNIANNEIINKATVTARYNINIQNSKQMNIYHNSSYIYSTTNIAQSAPIYVTGSSSATKDLNIYNNIFYNASTSSTNKNYAIYLNYTQVNALAATVKLNGNEYFTIGNSLGWFVAPRNTFGEWQSALADRGDDVNSVNLPLIFTSATDSLVPTIFEGLECTPVSGITTDICGRTRYNTITFMGCYTRDIPNTDLSITELTSPALGNDCPATSYPVKIKIKNTGSGTINFANKNATVNYTIGTTTGSSVINTGTIAPMQSMEVTVVNNFPVTINTIYDYTFQISINGDDNHANDSLMGIFEIQAAFPYFEEVFSSSDLYPSWKIEQISGAGNWTIETGEGVNPVIAPSYGLGRLFFNSKNFPNNTESRAIMPVTLLQGAQTPILEYWFAHDNSGSSNTEGVTVKISTDGGVTYTAAPSISTTGATSTLVKRYNSAYTTPGWAKYMVDLANYSSQNCIYIAFDAKSNAKNNINIDRVVVRNFYNNDLAVNDIWALGDNPTQHKVDPTIYANISNEGRLTQNNFKLMLEITGANTYRDTIIVPSLASRSSMVVAFDGAHLNNNGDNIVRIYCEADMNNDNNEHTWNMTTTTDEVGYAIDSIISGQHISFASLATGSEDNILYASRYNVVDTLIVTHVKAFITNTDADNNIGRHFRFFVADEDGDIIETSEEMTVSAAMEDQWVSGEINNFSLTSTDQYFYAGIEMIDGGTYLGVQEEAPLRDNTFYTINDGELVPATIGRLMINAVVAQYMANEIAIQALLNPVSDCDLGHEDLILEIANNGTQAIMPGTNIHYTINGSNAYSTTINETIESHESIQFAFNAPYDFTNNLVNTDVPYDIKVWVDQIATDRVRFNDTLSTTVISNGKAPKPVVPSVVHADYHTSATITAQDTSSVASTTQFWYTNTGYESWELQYVGNPFVTPSIYFDTTYYVATAPATISDITVDTLTTASANNVTQPFIYTAGYSRGKILYKENELNATGQLTRIALYVTDEATGENGIPMKMYVMPTDLNSLTASSVTTWDEEIAQATLIYDGSYFFNTTGWHYFNLPEPMDYDGGNLLILTETNCGGSNCAEASGASGYPKFNATAASNCVLYKSVNTTPNFTGNYSTYGKRLNMKFQFVDAECASEKVPVQVIADNVPIYDVEPIELLYPITNTCTLGDENVVVTVRNLINNTIPANTVQVTFKSGTHSVTHIIDEAFGPNEDKVVTFNNTFNFSAPTADVTYNYTIITDLIGTPAYHGNDTITGSIVSKKTTALPEDTYVTGEYLHTYTIPRQNATITKWYYENITAGTAPVMVQSSPYTYTTPTLYDTTIFHIYGITPTSNCETRHMVYQINVAKPLHDISTNALVSPVSYQCGISNTNLQVNVSNTSPTADTIPGNTFKLKAKFTGASTQTGEHTITQPIYTTEDGIDITFANAITLGSATQNNIYNYTIYSDPVDPNMYVYRANDTITGTLYVPATPEAPANITANAPYGGTATITPTSTVFNQYYFYNQPTGGEALAQGTSFTTPAIMQNPTLFYYSGRILDPNFGSSTQVGNGSTSNALPFNFGKEHSRGIVMYTATDLGFSEGIIDTLSIFVQTAGNGNIPMKLYLKNDNALKTTVGGITYPNLTPALLNTVYHNKWNNIIENAQVIAEGYVDLSHTGWYTIVIPGGFHYTGDNLLLITEHDGSANTEGYTAPAFKSTTVPNIPNSTYNKRVVYYANDNNFNPASAYTYTQGTLRFNTKFGISYACESAQRGVITVNTNVPAIDLEVVDIVTPVTPNAAYTNNETVKVHVANHGGNTASSYKISYQLADEAPVEVNNPTAVPSNDTITYTFATHVDLTDIYFPTPFKVYVTCTSDTHHDNDTVTIFLAKEICASGAMTVYSPCIANIQFGGIDNVPLPSDWSPFNSADSVGYTDYTQTVLPAILVKGQTYTASMTNSFTGNSGTKLFKYFFIDYNRNGSWDLTGAANERALSITQNSFNSQHPENATSEGVITIPETAESGLTLMRVVAANAAYTSGCGYFSQGETEDYAVMIREAFDDDLAVVGYSNHTNNNSCCADEAANIGVIVKNYGMNIQDLSSDNPLTLTAVVTNDITSDTYTQDYVLGTLLPDETMTFTINDVDLSMPGNYTVTTTLTYESDEYSINDSWSTQFIIVSTPFDTVPHLETFDEEITDVEHPFTDFWTVNSNHSGYAWNVQVGASPNNPNAGPNQDHTPTNVANQYALVAGSTSQTSTTYYTTLTSNCIDLHYRNGYPIQMDYWEHMFGANNAGATLLVQVGTGDDFVTVDSVVAPTQTSYSSSWKNRVVMFLDNDEVAKVRFMVKSHTRLMDVAVDDVNFSYGLPDIGVADILYPKDFTMMEEDDDCLVMGDSIHPIVAVVNAGRTPVAEFDITGTLKVGNDLISFTEHWDAPSDEHITYYLMPGDTVEYEFENPFVVFSTAYFSDFVAKVYLEGDYNPYNDIYTIHPCSTTGVEDYVQGDGLVLNQNIPNPADNKTRINFLVPQAGKAVIEIFTLTGQKLYSENIDALYGENYIDINTSSYAAGMYIYTLQFGDTILTKKMIIEK